MSFKSASFYAGISAVALGGLFYSDNVQAMIWIPSFFKMLIVIALLIPIFNWLNTVEQFGRREPRMTETGGAYGRIRIGTRIMLSVFLVPITLLASPPALRGNFESSWSLFGIVVFSLGLYGLVLLRTARVTWDDTALRITSPFHLGDRVFPWKSLSNIKYKRKSGYAALVFEDAGNVRVGHYMEGYADLMAHAENIKKHA
ncbi:MAG: hypothetical protein AAGB07_16075 [Pseudomonadota bacterium]